MGRKSRSPASQEARKRRSKARAVGHYEKLDRRLDLEKTVGTIAKSGAAGATGGVDLLSALRRARVIPEPSSTAAVLFPATSCPGEISGAAGPLPPRSPVESDPAIIACGKVATSTSPGASTNRCVAALSPLLLDQRGPSGRDA